AVNYVSSEGPARDVVENIKKMGRHAILAQADVGDYPDTFRMAQEVLREFGHLDILVNNAGINSAKSFVKMDHASWRKVLGINLDGVFNCTKVFIDGMPKQNYGRVVNMTSLIGQIGRGGAHAPSSTVWPGSGPARPRVREHGERPRAPDRGGLGRDRPWLQGEAGQARGGAARMRLVNHARLGRHHPRLAREHLFAVLVDADGLQANAVPIADDLDDLDARRDAVAALHRLHELEPLREID